MSSRAWRSRRAADAPLQFRVTEGSVLNAFHQQGPVAAHLLLSSGRKPRVLVAFPAGNSGVGVWFEDATSPVQWTLGEMKGIHRPDASGRPLHGITAETSVVAKRLVIRDAVLGSVRVLRDFQFGVAYPASVATPARISAHGVTWARARLDGAPGYAISIELLNGRVRGGKRGAPLVLAPTRDGEPLRLRITALTGEKPLTPLTADELLDKQAGSDLRSRQALQFLSYREKFLAGSWRFDTYFGRDTLMSLRLLMPALQPEAIEDGLASVLDRLNAQGEVAHEEDIGEFALLRHRKESAPGAAPNDAPIYDYKMIDDDVMLAPVAAAWLLDHAQGRDRAAAFLARKTTGGEALGAALARNFAFVAAIRAGVCAEAGRAQSGVAQTGQQCRAVARQRGRFGRRSLSLRRQRGVRAGGARCHRAFPAIRLAAAVRHSDAATSVFHGAQAGQRLGASKHRRCSG